MSKLDALRTKAPQLLDDLINSNTVKTLRNAGLFGVSGAGKNPWVEKLDDLALATTKKRLNRTYDLEGAGAETVDKFLQQAQKAKSNIFGQGKEISELAQQHGIAARGLPSQVMRHAGGALADVNPAKLVFGTPESRTQFMHNLWEGGLVGKGSALQKAVTPGEALGRNAKKYKNILLGREALPSLGEAGKDALETSGAIAKPLFLGGAIFPAASVANRLASPEEYDEGALRGSLRDLGWYAGMTTGVPLGIAGVHAGSSVGQRVGDSIGAALEKGLSLR